MKKTKYETFFEKKWVKKIGISCLIALILINISILFADPDVHHVIRIKPISISNNIQPATKVFHETEILQTGLLKLNKPRFSDRLIFRTTETAALTDLLIYLLILLMLFKSIGEFKDGEYNVFRNRIWTPLIQIGFLLMLLFLINVIKDFVAIRLVKKYTDGKYIPDEHFFHWVQFWGGLLLAYFATLYKKGYDLQNEQDLTV